MILSDGRHAVFALGQFVTSQVRHVLVQCTAVDSSFSHHNEGAASGLHWLADTRHI
jgi:hypothetical protein